MDLSATSWISEMGLEDPSFSDQYDILDLFDEDYYLSAAIGHHEEIQNSWSQESTTLMPRSNSTTSLRTSSSIFLDAQNYNIGLLEETMPAAYLQPNLENLINGETSFAPSPMNILTFGNTSQTNAQQHVTTTTLNIPQEDGVLNISSPAGYLEEIAAKKAQSTKKTTRTRPPSQTYDHIIAERKRREQLSQQFVALSAIVPGLKKMDKTSVLGDAINYLKKLQERVNSLEEKASKQKMESLVLVKKTQVLIDEDEDEDEGSNSDDQGGSYDEQHLPEIEAKLCDKNVLLRIQCEKHKGVLGKIFSVIQKLNLAVINTNVTPFGNMALDITIVAQMDKELNLTMKELVKSLRSSLMFE